MSGRSLYSHSSSLLHALPGMVTAMDEAIGEIVKTLKANSLYEDTVFMFMSRSGGDTRQGGSNWPLR